MGKNITDKYTLWLNFKMINENALHRTGRVIGSMGGGITLQIEKKAGMAGELKAYFYLIMDAQLNIQSGAFISAMHLGNGNVMHDGTPYSIVCGSDWVG